jgi:beta-lactamase regulating signal transducer with metallopeptidase domain
MSSIVVALTLKISAIVILAGMAIGLMHRRASAAARHLVWTLAAIGVLMLPVASMVLPSWTIPIHQPPAFVAFDPPATPNAGVGTSRDWIPSRQRPQTASTATSTSWMVLLPAGYVAGMFLLLIRLGVGQSRILRLVSRATDVTGPHWTTLLRECSARIGLCRPVRLVWSREPAMPMACGLREAVVVVPLIAETWDEDRRRAVLLHELAHVARFDCLTQLLAEVAVALYWVHPGTWWVARRLRIERELACDDCVLSSGFEPREYARHLLEIAYTFGGSRTPALVVSMARPRQIERRLRATLDATRNRGTPATSPRLLTLALAAAVIASLAAVKAAGEPGAPAMPAEQAGAQASAAAPAAPPGTWAISPSDRKGRLELTLRRDPHAPYGTTVPVELLEGLSPEALSGTGGPVTFSLGRDAGVFAFEGVVRSGVGGGTYAFAPSMGFQQGLSGRGFARPTTADQYSLALADVGFAFLDELATQKYARPDLTQLVNAAQHGVGVDYVRQMGQLGYRLGDIDGLIRQRDHGVSPAFIRDLRAQGLLGLTSDDLVRARDHGVSPEYVAELGALGHMRLSLDALVGARDHGISPDYVRGLRQLGYQLSLADLTRARDHGVSVEYIKDVAELGYRHLVLDDLVRLRDHGVSASWLRKVESRSATRLSIDDLVSMRDHGVDRPEQRGPQLHRWTLGAELEVLWSRWLNWVNWTIGHH